MWWTGIYTRLLWRWATRLSDLYYIIYMKLNQINEDGKEPVVKIDQMPAYKVVNPTEEEKDKAADEQDVKDTIVKKGSEADKEIEKEEPKEVKGDSKEALKTFVANILKDISDFIKSI